MSKANGKILWEKLDEYEQELLVNSGAKIKYLFGKDEVVVLMYGDYKFSVPFDAFEYMIKFDKENGREKIYRSNDVTDFYVVKKNVDVAEEYRELQFKVSEDVYEDVCLLQYKYRLEPGILGAIKKAAHVRKLGRTKSAWLTLQPRILKGGRPRGGCSADADNERLEYLYSNYDSIVKSIVCRDSFVDFCDLERELNKRIGMHEIREKYNKLKKMYL